MFKHATKVFALLFVIAGITLFISCQEQQPVATNDAGQMNLSKVSSFIMPPGASFVSANLKLYAHSWAANPQIVEIHNITADWSCPVTWNSFAGAFNPANITTFNTGAVVPEWKTIDITSTVQAWITGGMNYGLLLKNQDIAQGLAQWWSNEYVLDPTLRPYLEIVTTAGTFEIEPLYDTFISSLDADNSECDFEKLYCGYVELEDPPTQAHKYTLIRFDIVPTPQCYQEETAWAANGLVPGSIRYVPRGNWATYLVSPTVNNTPKTVNIYAGKTIYVGQATITKLNGTVDIDIVLSGGWELDPMETEAVKIQGYSTTPPPVNPAPGLFTTYKGNGLLNITVPYFAYYGIHLDVRKPIICP